MFKFDFNVDDSNGAFSSAIDKQTSAGDLPRSADSKHDNDKVEWYPSERVLIQKECLDNIDVYKLNCSELVIGEVTLKYLITGCLLQDISKESEGKDIKVAEDSHTDLIPGIYEGGAKIWECTYDLLRFLSNETYTIRHEIRNKRVLDLGCGSGLLGILAYKWGAYVHFQDYNKDVLQKITIPTVLLNIYKSKDNENLDLDELNDSISFYSGDWQDYVDITNDKDSLFDIILTSETIYNPQNYQKLINTFRAKLTDDGSVYVAAKSYYFGVGGGIRQFQQLAQKCQFDTKTVWVASNEGLSREIIVLKRESK